MVLCSCGSGCLRGPQIACLFCKTKYLTICENLAIKKDVITKPWQKEEVEITYVTLDGNSAKFNWVIKKYGTVGTDNKTMISKDIFTKFYTKGEIIKYYKVINDDIGGMRYMVNLTGNNYSDGLRFSWGFIKIER